MSKTAGTRSIMEMLLEKQVITPDTAGEVKRLQDETGKAPEQILVELGALTEDDLSVFIGDALQVRYIKLEDVEIDREAVKHVPAAVAHRYLLVPVRRSGNTLVVAFADPANSEAQKALRGVTDFEIIPFVARHDAIEHALYVHYGEPPAAGSETSPEPYSAYVRSQMLMDDDRFGHMGKSIQLNRQWNFDQFVCDAASQFPLSVAKAIAEAQPDTGYNPFLCWGPTGCGKSHLMHAMVNYVSTYAPLKRTLLTTGERFADGLFEAIRDKKLNLFRYLYREVDLVVIDDSDALLTREWAQLELLETYHDLSKQGRQLVLASRENLAVNPRCMGKLRDALQSGVIAGFGEYSVDAKLAMISRKKGGIELPQDMLMYLVRRCGSRVSDLLAVLQQVSVLAMYGEREITQAAVEDFIRLCGIEAPPTPEDLRTAMMEAAALASAPGPTSAPATPHGAEKRAVK
jgi:chromosomal replication initiation ATPase DnaA